MSVVLYALLGLVQTFAEPLGVRTLGVAVDVTEYGLLGACTRWDAALIVNGEWRYVGPHACPWQGFTVEVGRRPIDWSSSILLTTPAITITSEGRLAP